MKKKWRNSDFCRRKLPRMFIIMKTWFVLLFVCTVHLNASNLYSQQKKMDISMKNASLVDVFRYIRQNSDYTFVYDSDAVKQLKAVSLDMKNVAIEEILDQCFKGSPFVYLIEGNLVIVKEQKGEQQQAKSVRVKGFVYDTKKQPMPGVTVIIKGTTLGTATDVDGKYSLSLPENKENQILIFTMVGMETQEIVVGKQTEINVIMKEMVSELEDVVVTGYYTQSKNSYTGAARIITAEKLQKGGNQNILTTLQNVDPSFVKLINNQMGSNPNSIPDFQIRGAGSISGVREEYSGNPNTPVFIVDDFETTAERVFDMDPYRVASITLLKDAAATAIYGSRASNGVVVITTIAPASGKMAVSYNGDVTFYTADLSAYNLCDASKKLKLEVLAGLYDVNKKTYYTQDKWSDGVVLQDAYNRRLSNIQQNVNTYWLDKPLNGMTLANKHSLRLDGGNDYIRYAMEINYNNTPGVMKKSGRERIGLGVELQYIYKNLTFREQLTYTKIKATNSPYGSFSEYTKMNPYEKYKDEDGKLIYLVEEDDRVVKAVRSTTDNMYNPMYNATLNVTDEEGYNDLTNLLGIDWHILEGLRLKGSFAFTIQNTFADVFKPAKHTDFANYVGEDFDRRGSYTASRGDKFSYDASLVLSYFWRQNKHIINSNLGWNVQQEQTKSFTVMAEGFPNENLDYISFASQYQKAGSPSGDEYTSRLVGFLGNLNYSYDERFLLDLSFREDASSQFGADNRWAPFWSAGLGWNLHHENFFKKFGWLQQFKIRGSYGLTGSQDYDPYQAITTYEYLTSERYHYAVGAIVMAMGNRNLAWQRTLQQNYGVDMVLWNGRVDLSADYYIKTSKDVLTTVTLPPSLGFSSYMDNLGEVENRGWELNLKVDILKSSEHALYWSVNGSAIHNKNKLLKISNALRAYNDTQDEKVSMGKKEDGVNVPRVRYVEGASMNSIWVNHSLGIDPATGNEIFEARNGDIVSEWSTNNYVIGGCTDPDVEGNFGTSFSWKGLQLNMTFRYRIGGQMYNQTLVDKVQDVNPRYNADRRAFEDRWQKPGDKVRFAAFSETIKGINVDYVTRPTSRFIEEYNYLELVTFNLSYEFGVKRLERLGIKRLKTMFYMNDVFHASSIKQERGIDYPFARNFSIGLQVRF